MPVVAQKVPGPSNEHLGEWWMDIKEVLAAEVEGRELAKVHLVKDNFGGVVDAPETCYKSQSTEDPECNFKSSLGIQRGLLRQSGHVHTFAQWRESYRSCRESLRLLVVIHHWRQLGRTLLVGERRRRDNSLSQLRRRVGGHLRLFVTVVQ